MKFISHAVLISITVACFQNCGPGFDPNNPTTVLASNTNPAPVPAPLPPAPAPVAAPTFKQVFTNIISPKCVLCHGPALAGGGITLASYNEVMTIVVPGNTNASPLYTDVVIGRMPQGTPLSQSEIKMISAWITAGALNN